TLNVHDPLPFLLLLAHDVTKHTTLFLSEPFASRAQFVLDAARNKNRASNFGVRVRPFFACQLTLILEDADVFQANVFFEVRDSRNPSREHAVDLFVAKLRQSLVVVWCLDDGFMRAGGTHPVIHAVRLAARLALDTIKWIGVRQHAHLPRSFGGDSKNSLLFVDRGPLKRA